MLGGSFSELILVFGVALIVFGPEKLPEIARTLGKFMGQMKRASDDIRREFYNSVYKPTQDFERKLTYEARSLVTSVKEEITNPDGTQASAQRSISEQKNEQPKPSKPTPDQQ